MNCKDCIHFDVCKDYKWVERKGKLNPSYNCPYKKDKSRIIELPCKIGDTVYYVYHGWMSDSYVTKASVCGISIDIYERKNKCVYLKIIYKDLDGNSDRAESIYGSRVFLTKKEAKTKLKELRK